MKRYGYPLGIVIFGGWLIRILQAILESSAEIIIIKIVIAVICFGFGLSLNPVRKRKQTWIKKLLVAFVLIFFLLLDLGYLSIPQLQTILHLLAIEGVVVYLIYVFCGWTFFD